MDYIVYAYLQIGQDKKAQAVIDEMNKIESRWTASQGHMR